MNMIETALAQYGILGVWTITLLAERYIYTSKIQTVIENNTTAITKVYEVISRCPKKK